MVRFQRNVLLVQLPIPPPGPEPIKGNVPLAAGYLKLFAEGQGLADDYNIQILPTALANTLGDAALAENILARQPWLVGFSCYLWNIERTLWIASRLKEARPGVQVVIGGPEVAADNQWVLEHPAIDYAVIGEGEQTFAALLSALLEGPVPATPIDGLFVRPPGNVGGQRSEVRGRRSEVVTHETALDSRLRGNDGPLRGNDGTVSPLLAVLPAASGRPEAPAFRKPLPNLNDVSSPYLSGILDAADEEMLLLETIRGCIFKCKFCYYPKSYDALYFLSEEKIVANLRHAQTHAAREVVLLDPTLNQRRDFADFLRLLARENPGRRMTYFGELRAEGITAEIARLLRKAHFTEVEIGLQSIDPLAMDLMDRKNNLRAYERGARAMLDEGIKVKVDLIIGLPGDSIESIRRGIYYIRDSGLYSSAQVFNLAILPGTAFRQEAEQLGLVFQPRPPYYVVRTPTLSFGDIYDLMCEAQEAFDTEFDPMPPPVLDFPESAVWPASRDGREPALIRCWRADLDAASDPGPLSIHCSQAFTLWLTAADFRQHLPRAAGLVAQVLAQNPFTTLQVVLEPTGPLESLDAAVLEAITQECFRNPTYLDRFYAVLPSVTGGAKAAKRLVVVVPAESRGNANADWAAMVGDFASLIWRETSLGAASATEEAMTSPLSPTLS